MPGDPGERGELREASATHLLRGALLLLGTAAACAHAPPPKPVQVMQFDPVEIVGGDTTDLLLASMNDEELFAKGTSAYAAGDFKLAAKAYDRLCDLYPASAHFAAATYDAGLAHEQMGQWQEAHDRYAPLLDIEHGTSDQIDAGFRSAECLYHLAQYEAAIQILVRIQARKDLSENLQLEATTQIGICQVESGKLNEAEATLREVVKAYDSPDLKERIDDYYPAQAQFYLGEIYRTYFSQSVLDPNKPGGTEQLAKDLEYKAELLLSAQGHYLRAIRMGNSTWATASGARVGELYEEMYDAMIHAPAPADLKADEVEVYRQELRKKVRVLITKAITIYERTLEAAERTGTTGPFVDQARASLDRMKNALLVDSQKGAAASPNDAAPASPPPAEEPGGASPGASAHPPTASASPG